MGKGRIVIHAHVMKHVKDLKTGRSLYQKIVRVFEKSICINLAAF